MYILKTNYGAVVEEHSNGVELNYVFKLYSECQRFDKHKIRSLYKKFKDQWDTYGIRVFEVSEQYVETTNWL